MRQINKNRYNPQTIVLLLGLLVFSSTGFCCTFGNGIKQNAESLGKDSLEAKALCKQAEDFYNGSNGQFMNRDKAKELYIRAAEMNYAPAQYEIYEKWKDRDCLTAKKYLQKAAEQRYVPALISIAEEYVDPTIRCMEQSDELAAYWARIGAEMGVDELQFMLGLYYYTSEAKDVEQAKYWFGMQAIKGDADSQRYYGLILQEEGNVTGDANMTAEGIAWIEKAALQGDDQAMFHLGVTNLYVKKNIPEAVKWLRNGSDKGNEDCMLEYAGMLKNGTGVKKDEKAAFSLFLQVAEKGRPEGQRFVALSYWLGNGVKKDKSEALMWFKRAAANGDKQSMEFLSNFK